MANQIRLKRGSGSDPGTSDLAVGEIAVRTDNGKLFTKKDNGTVAEITGGGGIDDGDKGDITVSNSGGTFTIDSGVIDNANINASAAIAGSKIDPDFATQDIITTGTLSTGNQITINGGSPLLKFNDNNNNPDYRIEVDSGVFNIIDETNSNATRLSVASDGQVNIAQKLNCNGGLDTDGDVKFNSGTTNMNILFDASQQSLEFDDGVKATFGFDQDLQIFHDGSNSVIRDNGTGSLFFQQGTSNKLQITSSGVTVSGTCTATAFSGPLTGNVTGDVSGSSGSCTGNAASADTVDVSGASNQNASFMPLFVDDTGSAKTIKVDSDLTYNPSTNVFSAGTFSGSGASLTSLNASNISSGTLAAARVATLNQNTTGSSASCTGNSATATKLANARTIAGVSFDGSANISLNNNSITNGAGYITSADGGNAATLDNIDSSQFLRSDAADTFSGDLTSSGSARILLKKTDNNVSDHIQFYNGTTRVGEIGCEDNTWLRINQETAKNIYTPRYIRADGGFFVDGTSKGINGSGNFFGGTISGASDYSTLLRSDTADTASGDITFSGGAGAATINAGSDIRFTNSNSSWTGNATKIQHYGNILYIGIGSSGVIFREDGTNRWQIDGSGHFDPGTDSTYDIGSSSVRVRNGYFDTLYGDGSNLTGISGGLSTSGGTLTGTLNARAIVPTANNTYALGTASARWSDVFTADFHLSNKGSSNQVDNTWGDFTIQEGKDDLFLLNNRNGKMYKFMLQEVS